MQSTTMLISSKSLLMSYVCLIPISTRTFCVNSNFQVGHLMSSWKNVFEKNNIPEAERSVHLIMSSVIKCKNLAELGLHYSRELSKKEMTEFIQYCECRMARMPVQYIVKRWEFRDIEIDVTPPVFIPRPETESLIDIVLESTPKLKSVLEIGCGSGAISISLLKESKNLKAIAIDRQTFACEQTLSNAKLNGVENRITVYNKKITDQGEIENLENDFDTIVSNPPYVFTSELPTLDPELRYEDILALNGGTDGLRIIKAILIFASKRLKPSQNCYLEMHCKHGPLIKQWLEENKDLKLELTHIFKDLFGHERFVSVTKI